MLLPIHPQPQKDELLSSWMVRLAIENGFFIHTFYRQILECDFNIWNRDIDRLEISELYQILSSYTLIDSADIHQLTLNRYEGYLFEKMQAHGHNRWIMPLGIYHRNRLRPGIQYCPLCLKSDSKPYFRQHWRISLVALCEKHGCLLESYCLECCVPVNFHRLGINKIKTNHLPHSLLTKCFNCGSQYDEVGTSYPNEIENYLLKNYKQFLKLFLSQKWYVKSRFIPISISYFDGLWILISVILGRRGGEVRQKIYQEIGIQIKATRTHTQMCFDYLSVRERLNILCVISWLIYNWPSCFIELCSGTRLSKSGFCDYADSLPFWLSEVVCTQLTKKVYIPSNQEIMFVAEHLNKVERPVTIRKLSKFMSVGVDVAANGFHYWKSMKN